MALEKTFLTAKYRIACSASYLLVTFIFKYKTKNRESEESFKTTLKNDLGRAQTKKNWPYWLLFIDKVRKIIIKGESKSSANFK